MKVIVNKPFFFKITGYFCGLVMDRFRGEIKSQSDTIRINQKHYEQHVHDHYTLPRNELLCQFGGA